MKTLKIFTLFLVLIAFMVSFAISGDSESYKVVNPSIGDFNHIKSIRILAPEVSQSLKLTRVPTSKPIPLIIGHYWRCITYFEKFESCEQVLVVCTNDQKFCTEIP